MTDHSCTPESRFLPGQGKRHRTTCTPCKWTSQWHRTRAEADQDYQAHTTPRVAFYEPADVELIGYGLHPSLVTGQQYGTDPRGRRG